jgi:hypothetical protein
MSDSTIPQGTYKGRHSDHDRNVYALTEKAFETSRLKLLDKLEAFPRFVTKRSIARFIAKERLFQKIVDVNGVVVECGVFNGAGLFTWAHLTNIFEPVNYTRKIIGFDTFEGFPSVSEVDNCGVQTSLKGDLAGSPVGEYELSIERYNDERHLSHISNIELVKGDFNKTAETYVEKNPHTIVALLYLDFDLYEPTKKALEIFLPRMPKGAVVAFDEVNCESFPGETRAFDEIMGIGKHELRRFPFDPWISYIVL